MNTRSVLKGILLLSAFSRLLLCATTHYVDVNSRNPVAPYTNWFTAARVIQDVVDVAQPGDDIVVTNGVYAVGGRAVYPEMTNRVAITKPITIRSVNGPEVTVIRGYQVPGTTNGPAAVRCAYLAQGASLSGFTLSGGAVTLRYFGDGWSLPYQSHEVQSGGGVWCESTNVAISNCVLISNSANYGGAAFSGTLQNCILATNNAGFAGGAAVRSILNNCSLTANTAGVFGGAVKRSTLNQCSLADNSAPTGGAADASHLNQCTISGNSAERGGGASGSRIENCLVTRNSADFGGGLHECLVNHCTVVSNLARKEGGGVWFWTDPIGDAATPIGCDSYGCYPSPECHSCGGDYALFNSVVSNSIIHDNTAPSGANYPNNMSNRVPGNYSYGIFNYSSTTPIPTNGVGNIGSVPLFVDAAAGNFRLSGDSPLINAGRNSDAPGDSDLDGNPRIVGGLVDIGAYEYQSVVRYVNLESTNPVPPYSSWATAAKNIQHAVDVAKPGDDIVVTNGVYAVGGRAVYPEMTNRVAITKPITIRSVNGPEVTVIRGYQVPGTTNGPGAVRCVYLAEGASLSGFTLTGGAVTLRSYRYHASLPPPSHEDQSGGGVWCESTNSLISNCVFLLNSANYGGAVFSGMLQNCILATNTARLAGGAAVHSVLRDCALVANVAGISGGAVMNANLDRCVLTRNSAVFGGAAANARLSRSIITRNAAEQGGGGVSRSLIENCLVFSNTADFGGGLDGSLVNSCTIVANTARIAGGGIWFWSSSSSNPVDGPPIGCDTSSPFLPDISHCGLSHSLISNSIVYDNTAPAGANYPTNFVLGAPENHSFGMFSHSCTTPLPANGSFNITNAPVFMDPGAGNFRLAPASPCINAGLNLFPAPGFADLLGPYATLEIGNSLNLISPPSLDLDGNPRIAGGTLDMGAYELESPASTISYAWLLGHGLPIDGGADLIDADGDGFTAFQEWEKGSNPIDPGSFPFRVALLELRTTGVALRWDSAAGRRYAVDRSTNSSGVPIFTPVAKDVLGISGVTGYIDTNPPSAGALYRVRLID